MVEENTSQEFLFKNTKEIEKNFIEEIDQNELISKNHKTVSTTLNYIAQFLVLASAVTGCVSVSAFASLVGISIGITRSALLSFSMFQFVQ